MALKDWLPWVRKAPKNKTARSRDKPEADWQTASFTRADRHLQNSEIIYSAVARVSGSLALMPLTLRRGGEIVWDHPLHRLVYYDPTPRMNVFEWKRAMQANVQDQGRAYSAIRRGADGVSVVRLELLDPTRVTDVIVNATDEVWHYVSHEDGTTEWIPDCDMIFLRGLSTNGVHGVSQHSVLQGALEYDQKVRDYTAKAMDGVNSTITINVPNTGLSPEKQKAIIDEFWELYTKTGGKAVVLQGGMTLSDVTRSPIDTNAADVSRQTANRVATVNMMPAHMLGDRSDTSFATAEQDMLEFRQTTLLSLITMWETELDRKLLTWDMIREGYAFTYDMKSLLRADSVSMANKHATNIRAGVQTINEARREEDLPPVAGGDVPLISRDLAPLTGQVNPTKED